MNTRYLCDGCASTIELGPPDNLTTLAPRFCPLCGGCIRKVKASSEWLTATCIAELQVNPELTQLLFMEWRKDAAGHSMFIDYLRERLA